MWKMTRRKWPRIFSRYGYQAIPVVDGDNRLVGIITVDDVIDVLNEEFTEDLHHLAGIGKEEKVDGSVADSVKSRLPWLAVNLVTALAASFVINLFNGTIAKNCGAFRRHDHYLRHGRKRGNPDTYAGHPGLVPGGNRQRKCPAHSPEGAGSRADQRRGHRRAGGRNRHVL